MPDVFDLAPKVELHLHLEGALPLLALWDLVEGYGDPEVRTLEDLASRFEYRDFPHFIEAWWWMTGFIRTDRDFMAAAQAVAATLVGQNVVYAEASISPSDFARHGLTVGEIATAVRSGLDRVNAVEVGLIVDLVRDTGPERCMSTLEQVIEVADEAGVVGITIGGSEQKFPPELFTDVYQRADVAGLGLTAHAGEAAGPGSVWSALNDLGVSRIGHGVRSVEDPSLVAYLVEHQIPLEMCPTSNLRTGVVESWNRHPVVELIERGARVTINSDDPLFFDCSVAGDMRKLADYVDLDVERHTLYAIDASWMSDDKKSRRRTEVTDWWNHHARETTDPGWGD
jgi:adenosine deaminase